MNLQALRLIIQKIKDKYENILDQVEHIPKGLNEKEKSYIKKQLKTNDYYKQLKKRQLEKREKIFFNTFTINNPYRSKNTVIANQKERQLLKETIYNHIDKEKIYKHLKYYILPCTDLNSYEQKILTDTLLISCIDKRLRPYKKIKATKLGTNKINYYLIKENWKRETNNHLVWKFELKRKHGFIIEKAIHKYRVDFYKKIKGKEIIGEIICTKQAITKNFKEKIQDISQKLGRDGTIILLAPHRLHKHLKHLRQLNTQIKNSATIIPYITNLNTRK